MMYCKDCLVVWNRLKQRSRKHCRQIATRHSPAAFEMHFNATSLGNVWPKKGVSSLAVNVRTKVVSAYYLTLQVQMAFCGDKCSCMQPVQQSPLIHTLVPNVS
jgi:hypothetical protein